MKGVVSAFFYTFARKNCIYKMNFKHNIPLQSHLSMLMAEVFWGLMAPLGKDAMTHGFDGISMVSMRGRSHTLLADSFVHEKGESASSRQAAFRRSCRVRFGL